MEYKKALNFSSRILLALASVPAVAALRVFMAPWPNVEPVMLFTLSAGVALGPLAGFVVGAGSMFASNVLLLGSPLSLPWLLQIPLILVYTSLAYGAVGALSGLLPGIGRLRMAALAGALTVFYDLVTAVCFGLQFYGPAGVYGALVAQVPFTLMHMSNVALVFVFAPSVRGLYARALVATGTHYLPLNAKTKT